MQPPSPELLKDFVCDIFDLLLAKGTPSPEAIRSWACSFIQSVVSVLLGPSLTIVLTSLVKLQQRYHSIYHSIYPVNEEIQLMINRAIQIVDLLANASWAQDCLLLMLTYQGEVRCKAKRVC